MSDTVNQQNQVVPNTIREFVAAMKGQNTPAIPAETSEVAPAPSMTEVYFYEVRSVHDIPVLPPFVFAKTLDEILEKWKADTAERSLYTTPIQHGMLPQGFKMPKCPRG